MLEQKERRGFLLTVKEPFLDTVSSQSELLVWLRGGQECGVGLIRDRGGGSYLGHTWRVQVG